MPQPGNWASATIDVFANNECAARLAITSIDEDVAIIVPVAPDVAPLTESPILITIAGTMLTSSATYVPLLGDGCPSNRSYPETLV